MHSLIVKNIKALREFHRLTMREFAEVIGVSEALISKIESGDLDPSSKFVDKLCRNFHVKPNDLYGIDLIQNAHSEPLE